VILAIDPGTHDSGYVIYDNRAVHESGILPNREMRLLVKHSDCDRLCIEMIASYGMAVGKEVFETCVWIGRYQEVWHSPDEVEFVYRKDVKLHLCGTPRAKDANIRAALIDLWGGKAQAIGTSKKPGALYGVKSHAWPALAVAVTAAKEPA
jgi:hypothetical protein